MAAAPVQLLPQAGTKIKDLRDHRVRITAQQHPQVPPSPRRLSLQTEDDYAQL